MNHRTESWSKTSKRITRRARHQWRGTVELLEQKQLLTTFSVTNYGSDLNTPNTLAWAITQSNLNPGQDVIDFNLGGGGLKTITLTTELPPITDFVMIDGTTQPGYNPADMTPVIQISGAYRRYEHCTAILFHSKTKYQRIRNQYRCECIQQHNHP